MLILALAIAQPVAAQSFKPDFEAGHKAWLNKDDATALKHFRPLAEQGHAGAKTMLGSMYLLSWGVTKDNAEAVRWYCLAAKQGYAKAQSELGLTYEYGNGVTRDYAEAVRWLRTPEQ
jgi:hypothetical protein